MVTTVTASGLTLRELEDSDDDPSFDPSGEYGIGTDPEINVKNMVLRKRLTQVNYNPDGRNKHIVLIFAIVHFSSTHLSIYTVLHLETKCGAKSIRKDLGTKTSRILRGL